MLFYGQINSTLALHSGSPRFKSRPEDYCDSPSWQASQASASNWLSSHLATPYPVHWSAIICHHCYI